MAGCQTLTVILTPPIWPHQAAIVKVLYYIHVISYYQTLLVIDHVQSLSVLVRTYCPDNVRGSKHHPAHYTATCQHRNSFTQCVFVAVHSVYSREI